ncbi:MAG: protein kinase [Victivallales bacterium]|nr:protein kinase [Victivallales bacterium]
MADPDSPVLLASGDKSLCDTICSCLREDGFKKVLTASTPVSAHRIMGIPSELEDTQPDGPPEVELLIADPHIEDDDGNSGIALCRTVKEAYPHVRVMLLVRKEDGISEGQLLDSGADDFVFLPFKPEEFALRVRTLLCRQVLSAGDFKESENSPRKIPFIGDRVGQYLVLDSLGMGKTSVIYKVMDKRDNNLYAMKLLSGAAGNQDEVQRRFEYEIEIMSQIDHPNVIKFHDRGIYRGGTFLVMEYLNGIDLEELLISRGRLPEKTVLSIAFDLACALSQIHDKGIIHRDIKLKNSIFIPSTKQVKLCDFGIAQLPNPLELTQEGMIVGTPIYMAPEIFGGKKASFASDIYSYGATVYHLATNTPPFVAESYNNLYELHSLKAPPPIESIRSNFSPLWTEIIVAKCLAKAPDKRPSSLAQVLSMLLRIQRNDVPTTVDGTES